MPPATPTTAPRTSQSLRKRAVSAAAPPPPAVLAATCFADAAAFAETAARFRDAGNLEETLAHFLLAVASQQHGLDVAPGTPAAAKAATAQLQRWLGVIDTLHAALQAKKDHFHGCLDDDDEADDSKKRAKAVQAGAALACDAVVPVDTAARPVTLASVVGHETIKADITAGIVQPFVQPLLFKVRRSFLFYGPPGTGKTLFARASAHSLQHATPNLDVLYYAPTADQLKDKFVGGTEKKITTYFRCVEQAAARKEAARRRRVPEGEDPEAHSVLGIIFLDELDSLARARDQDDASGVNASATNTLLQMMDGFTSLPHVVVMAATNYPWQLDDAILSRFQSKIYVRLPDQATVARLVQYYLLDHWHRVLGLPDVAALAGRGPQELERRFELYSHLCGLTPEKLGLVSRRLFAPLTYSPSNIKDVCNLVVRKSARLAHTHGVFHKVVAHLKADAAQSLTTHERELLAHCKGRYASATTYERMRALYPFVVDATPGVSLVGPVTQGGRPDTIQAGGILYTYVRGLALAPEHPCAAVVRALTRFADLHVYVEAEVTAREAGAAAPLAVALYQATTVSFGADQGTTRTLDTVATGALSPDTQTTLVQCAEAGVLDLQRYLTPLVHGSGQQQTLNGVQTVYLRDARASRKVPYVQCRVPAKHHVVSSHWGEGRAHGTPTAPLDVAVAYKGATLTANKVATRVVAWLFDLGAKALASKEAERKTRALVGLAEVPKGEAVALERHAAKTSAASNAAIQSKAFSLDVRTDAFFEATDASKFKDAVRPSSNANELGKFERYWKSGGVGG